MRIPASWALEQVPEFEFDARPSPWRVCARRAQTFASILAAYAWDAWSHLRGSGLLRGSSPEALKTRVLKSAHRLEMHLSVQAASPGCSRDAVLQLLESLEQHVSVAGMDWVACSALQVLQAWLDCQKKSQRKAEQGPSEEANQAPHEQGDASSTAKAWPDWVGSEIKRLRNAPACSIEQAPLRGGTREVLRDELLEQARGPFESLAQSPHSIHDLEAREIDPLLIERAIRTASYAPSVCNRSPVRVWQALNRDRIKALVQWQADHRALSDRAGALLVITARRAAFHTVGERHQGWIDGGLFAMSLIHALQAQGLGTCCLNWSVEPWVDRRFKQECGLPRDEMVVMLLAVGHLPERLRVACSPRRPLPELLNWV